MKTEIVVASIVLILSLASVIMICFKMSKLRVPSAKQQMSQVWLYMNLTIVIWAVGLLTCGLFLFLLPQLHTWPGFLIDMQMWFLAEFCYYKILLHFTSLEFAYATWILRNFQQAINWNMVKAKSLHETMNLSHSYHQQQKEAHERF